MKALWVILRKELLDAFRDRRMVLVAFVIMPLAIPMVLAVTSALGARQQVAKMEATLELPVSGAQRAPNLMAWLGSHNLRIVAAPGDPQRAVREQRLDVILRVHEEFDTDWRSCRPARLELIFVSSRPLGSGT